MNDILNVTARTETGTARMKRLRTSGKVPAVLYGHGQESSLLTLDGKELAALLNHNKHFVQLQGASSESALIKDVQFDHVETEVLHVDLIRVDATEQVDVTLEIILRGTAKGTMNGGVLSHVAHTIEIRCPAHVVPEQLELKIADLDVGHALRASDLTLPAGASLIGSKDKVIVQCVTPTADADGATTAAGHEPEVIARKKNEGAE